MDLLNKYTAGFTAALLFSLSAIAFTQTTAQLSEIETLKLENLKLKYAITQQQCQAADASIKAELITLQASIEHSHPGQTLDVEKGILVSKEPTHEPPQQ